MKISGLVGSIDSWGELRDFIVSGLKNCKTEERFYTLMVGIAHSIGTPKMLAKQREILGLPCFSEDELDKLEDLSKKGDEKATQQGRDEIIQFLDNWFKERKKCCDSYASINSQIWEEMKIELK